MRAPKIFFRLVIIVVALAFLLLVTMMLIPDAKPKCRRCFRLMSSG